MTVYRYDKGEIRSAHFTPEGFLVVDAIVTRTGVFMYRNQDGSLRRELRHPDDILKKDSLKSMEMLPITLLHPKEKSVDSLNASRLSKGFTGQSVTVDGKYIKNRLVITHQDAIDAVMSGMDELSLGYTVKLVDDGGGQYDDQRYDYKQTEVYYNHLAIVPAARAGKEAKIKLDQEDAFQCVMPADGKCSGSCYTCSYSIKHRGDLHIDNTELRKKTDKKTDSKHQTKEKKMEKIRIDGIEYEAAPEVINKLKKETDRADTAEKSLESATKEKSTLQANLDEANDKLKKAEETNNDEAIQTAVKARLDLVALATPHLDEETVKKIDQMSDNEIKLAVIKAHFPEFKEDGRDDVYIQARFDGAVEMKKEENNDGIRSQRQATSGREDKDDKSNRVDQGASRKDYIDNLKNGWKKTGTDDK